VAIVAISIVFEPSFIGPDVKHVWQCEIMQISDANARMYVIKILIRMMLDRNGCLKIINLSCLFEMVSIKSVTKILATKFLGAVNMSIFNKLNNKLT
jgi:hypothetical protein